MFRMDEDSTGHYVCDSCGRSHPETAAGEIPCCWDITEGGGTSLDFCPWCAERRMDAAYRGKTCHCCTLSREIVETAVERMAKYGEDSDPLVDDEVDAWHSGDHPQIPLWVWLGMTRDEYGEWVIDPDYIDVIVEKRKSMLRTKEDESNTT